MSTMKMVETPMPDRNEIRCGCCKSVIAKKYPDKKIMTKCRKCKSFVEIK